MPAAGPRIGNIRCDAGGTRSTKKKSRPVLSVVSRSRPKTTVFNPTSGMPGTTSVLIGLRVHGCNRVAFNGVLQPVHGAVGGRKRKQKSRHRAAWRDDGEDPVVTPAGSVTTLRRSRYPAQGDGLCAGGRSVGGTVNVTGIAFLGATQVLFQWVRSCSPSTRRYRYRDGTGWGRHERNIKFVPRQWPWSRPRSQ